MSVKEFMVYGLGILWSGFVYATPPTWGVLGPTIPIISPLGVNQNQTVEGDITPISYAQMVSDSLPLKSSTRPGKFDRYQIELATHVTQPLCLIGYDDYSLAWLQKNREVLARYNAVCFVMSATSLNQIKRIKDVAGDVIVQPVSGEQIALDFKVPAYPALIFDGWVVQ